MESVEGQLDYVFKNIRANLRDIERVE